MSPERQKISAELQVGIDEVKLVLNIVSEDDPKDDPKELPAANRKDPLTPPESGPKRVHPRILFVSALITVLNIPRVSPKVRARQYQLRPLSDSALMCMDGVPWAAIQQSRLQRLPFFLISLQKRIQGIRDEV